MKKIVEYRKLLNVDKTVELKDLKTILRKKLINSTSEIAEEIRIKVDGYPQKPDMRSKYECCI